MNYKLFTPPLQVALVTCLLLFPSVGLGQRVPLKSDEAKKEEETTRLLKRVVDAFLQSLSHGGVSQAYFAYTSEDFRKTTSYKDFTTFVERFPAVSRNQNFTVLNDSRVDNLGTLTGYAISTDGVENVVSFDVIFELQKWRILGIQVYPNTPTLDDFDQK